MMEDETKLSNSVTKIFEEFGAFAESDQEKRDDIKLKVRELEQSIREAVAVLAKIHHRDGLLKLDDLLANVDKVTDEKIKPRISALKSVIPDGQYYRFSNHFNFSLQRLVFVVCLVHYLRHDDLLSLEQAAERLEMTSNEAMKDQKLYLDLEDYLAGVIQLSNELSRFTKTCVVNGDLNRPLMIATFLSDVLEGYRLMNLKNDSLRKKFDSLKYDMKHVEDVVYDLSIRGLVKNPGDQSEKGDNAEAEAKDVKST